MAYCTAADVQARAGAHLDTLTTNPSAAEVEGFISDCDAQIDAAIAGHAHTVPVVNATALAALRPLSADGALVLAMDARFDRPEGIDGALILRDAAERRWMAGLAALQCGEHPVVRLLDTDNTPSSSLAASYGADEDTDPTDNTITRGMLL